MSALPMNRDTSAAYALLARSLGTGDRAGALAALDRVAADPALAPTLRRHHLVPTLYAVVPATDLETHLTAETLAACADVLRRPRPSPADGLRLAAEVQRALADDGVECMLLKGAYFADRLYGGLGRRQQYDVDLLVRRLALGAAGRRLAALGFVRRRRDLHSVTWERGGAQIDLHGCFRDVPV